MNLDLQFYWGLLLKRLPIMLALFLICSVGATVVALKMPPTYSTSAQLLVEEPQIPDSMSRALSQMDGGQQLQIIEQRLMTRANLLDIARKHNVFENMSTMTPGEIISGMRSQTRIRRTGGRGQATLMRISFQARWGQIAANVVNEYVTLILQEGNDFRLGRAESVMGFFEQEVERLAKDLALQSTKIVNFKNENADALPGDLNYRQNRQSQLQERQARLEREIASLEKQRRDLVTVFKETGRVDAPEDDTRTPLEGRLEKMEFDLQQALAIYSETNPRIALLRTRIAQLKKTIQEEAAARLESENGDTRPATLFELTLAEMDQRLTAWKEELEDLTKVLAVLEESIKMTAPNAIELEALERDFRIMQNRYNEVVANLDKARVTERIEVNAQGQRITVVENANVPQKPSGPKRFRMIATGFMAGGGLAAGFFILLELLNRAIRRPAELQSKFGIIPLAVIPYMESRRERMIRRTALISAFLVVLTGVPAALWYIDTQYMPLDILANKVFDRLGLT